MNNITLCIPHEPTVEAVKRLQKLRGEADPDKANRLVRVTVQDDKYPLIDTRIGEGEAITVSIGGEFEATALIDGKPPQTLFAVIHPDNRGNVRVAYEVVFAGGMIENLKPGQFKELIPATSRRWVFSEGK